MGDMGYTTLGFVLVTGVVMWLHLRSRADSGAAAPSSAPREGTPCPKCQARVPRGSAFCPACGVPQQVFELVNAPAASGTESGTGPARAAVRADMCVGCATCTAACPIPGAITMRGKLAVVDDALCEGHGECVRACPIGAISVTTGTAVNRVVVPLVDAHFESNVPGLYIVGELGGRGLIKNAVNEGKMAVEHIVSMLAPGGPRPDALADAVDVAIVGSGPAGLSAAMEALRCGLSYVVLEQGSIADSIRKYPRHKLILAESVQIPLYGDLWVADASKESLLQVWETIVANTGLQVVTQSRVENVARDSGVFHVTASTGTYLARRVVLAMGRRGSPRRLEVPGEELGKVFYDVLEMEQFAGRRVLVVGGGDSAVETAVGLANQAGTEVLLSYRGDSFSRVKERNREKIDRVIDSRRVKPLFGSSVREIRPDVVLLEVGGETMILPNDFVIVRVGGDAPTAFLEKIGVRMTQKDVPIPRDQARAS
jgi:putative YpdA family bacillithiol system oxidoreductase